MLINVAEWVLGNFPTLYNSNLWTSPNILHVHLLNTLLYVISLRNRYLNEYHAFQTTRSSSSSLKPAYCIVVVFAAISSFLVNEVLLVLLNPTIVFSVFSPLSVVICRLSDISFQSSVVSCQSSVIGHQSSVIGHQSFVAIISTCQQLSAYSLKVSLPHRLYK